MSELVSTHPFSVLTPDRVLGAVESFGYRCDGRLLALNSYENRVYQVGLEDREAVVAKFYRPGRWLDDAIAEEHDFAAALDQHDIPVVAPLQVNGRSLLRDGDFAVALYPRVAGRAPEFESADHLEWLGRLLARIHAIGSTGTFELRGELNADSFGWSCLESLRASRQVPADLEFNYMQVAEAAVQAAAQGLVEAGAYQRIRLHGDFHPGNILWGDQGPLIVDLDDARLGPAVQDLWMLLSGTRDEQSAQLAAVLSGYLQFNHFDQRELALIEPLRTLRLVHYAAWLATRWDDPAFPAAFPWFASPRWWDDQIQTLNEQLDRMNQPPLNPDQLE